MSASPRCSIPGWVGKKLALVDDQPGVTRDRRMGDADIAGLHFTVVDTAVWEDEDAHTAHPARADARPDRSQTRKGADAALFRGGRARGP